MVKSMDSPILLCSDLDRTLLPNGPAPESPPARPLLRALARHAALHLAYVSGRDLRLLQQAMAEYQLPVPRYAIGDVGTTIYRVTGDEWQPWPAWDEEIGPDWQGMTGSRLAPLLAHLPSLRLQEEAKQNRWKLSYYAPADADRRELFAHIQERLQGEGVRANLIWSVDDLTHQGLLDILPAAASKLHAIRFLLQQQGYAEDNTVFAGDSGNDLPVLASGLQAILVRNARDEVRAEAVAAAERNGVRARLYLAQGGLLGMNGNYSAGVLEGLVHFLPQTRPWLEAAWQRLNA